MTHPLTDAICEQIADTEDRPFTAIERDNMRAAADWQLEQMIELIFSTKTKAESWQSPRLEAILGRMASELRTSMRPTQEDN